jgi:hypothetical protein
MAGWSNWVDLELDDDDKQDLIDQFSVPSDTADYPCGARICLTERELDMLDLEADCEVGEAIHLQCMCIVTHVTRSDQGDRVELQITMMKAESEDDEDDDD